MKEELPRPSTSKMEISFRVYESRRAQGYSRQDSVRRTDVLSLSSSSSPSYRILPSRLVNIVVITMMLFDSFINLVLHVLASFSTVQQNTFFSRIFLCASYSRVNYTSVFFDKQTICQTDNSRKHKIIFIRDFVLISLGADQQTLSERNDCRNN